MLCTVKCWICMIMIIDSDIWTPPLHAHHPPRTHKQDSVWMHVCIFELQCLTPLHWRFTRDSTSADYIYFAPALSTSLAPCWSRLFLTEVIKSLLHIWKGKYNSLLCLKIPQRPKYTCTYTVRKCMDTTNLSTVILCCCWMSSHFSHFVFSFHKFKK